MRQYWYKEMVEADDTRGLLDWKYGYEELRAILVGSVPYPEKKTPAARLDRAVAFMKEFERVMSGKGEQP